MNWIRKIILVLLVVAMVATLTLAGATPARAQPLEVWVDDDWAGLNPGDAADGLIFGTDAFATIQEGIDVVEGSTVHVAAGIY